MRHTISLLVENRFGVLARIAGLFSGRGFNIDSLAVGETQDPSISRMTIVVRGDDQILEQVKKQMNKLIDVIKVQDFAPGESIQRELILVKVNATQKTRPDIMQIVDIFRAKIVEVTANSVTIEVTGSDEKVSSLLDLVKPFGIKDISRTGKIAMSRK
ncbi:MAG: acetolactate synthase small subunit [Candidatus Theseobacter exili]|nr:acetolactate synthase small subunit [Candidatus Theseobacter exili]